MKTPAVKFHTVFAALLLLALCCAPCPAAPDPPPLLLDPAVGRMEIPPHALYLEDKSGQLTLEEVASPPIAGRFRPYPKISLEEGHTASAFWFRFRLNKPARHHKETPWFFEAAKPAISQVDLFIPLPGGGWLAKRTGLDRPAANREIMHRSFVVSIPPDFDQSRPFYLRVRSVVSVNLNLILWTPELYIKSAIPDFFAFGAVYGVLLAMAIYNLAVFFFLHDRVYLYYVLYICSAIITMGFLYGHIPAFLEMPKTVGKFLLWAALSTTWLAAGGFVRAFLDTPKHNPYLDKVLIGLMVVAVMNLLSAAIGWERLANISNTVISVVGPITAITAGVVSQRKGVRPAGYFLFAWFVLLTGAIIYALGGVLIPRTFITRYTLAIGTPLEALILSLALAARIQAMRREREVLFAERRHLEHLSQTDPLTGLFNKRVFIEQLGRQIGEARDQRRPLSLLMLDVDDFKRLNDTHGHPEGDKVLKALSAVIGEFARESDTAYRYGGEEFAVLLPGANSQNAAQVAQRMRRAFAALVFRPNPGVEVYSSVSIGVAQLEADESGGDLVRRADQALYLAKRQGKNQVISSTD